MIHYCEHCKKLFQGCHEDGYYHYGPDSTTFCSEEHGLRYFNWSEISEIENEDNDYLLLFWTKDDEMDTITMGFIETEQDGICRIVYNSWDEEGYLYKPDSAKIYKKITPQTGEI